jgi:hypothetical protein
LDTVGKIVVVVNIDDVIAATGIIIAAATIVDAVCAADADNTPNAVDDNVCRVEEKEHMPAAVAAPATVDADAVVVDAIAAAVDVAAADVAGDNNVCFIEEGDDKLIA